ncbi:gliding motility-associated C-terminal domain-containing protein [uncultured Polaribacter sp.]|uniref:Ig-like domain-containing protein n=1 Tax=uncultured Polaribacter sp. TaxID=174711 RepID=UPI00261D6BDC|nr:gliding motility-associated C-terminal domain-containing protein [uncultured Polaribacter sp.]
MSQEFEKPILSYSYACASASFNSFEVAIAYTNASFNNNNTFTLELSDKNGDFSSPAILKTISNQNASFKFTTTFQIPTNVHGTGYKLRVKSSSPEKMSPESAVFEAYYITSERLILNNYTDVILCDGATKTLALNITNASKYQWYKDGVKFYLGGSTLEVTEPGLYYSEIFYGSCYAAVISNIVEVIKFPGVEAEIKGDAIVEVCLGSSHTLEASVNNSDYSYSWYKDGVKVASLPSYSPTYTITNSSDLGTYYVEIENTNGCLGTSEEVTVKETSTNFSIAAISETTTFILAGETKSLKIEHTAVNASVKWFKDSVEIANSNKNQIEITAPGIYKAKVTGGSVCASSEESPEFIVNDIVSLTTEIQIDSNYTSCQSSAATLAIHTILVRDSENKEHTLTADQFNYLDFKWLKDGTIFTTSSSKDLLLNNYDENGVYALEVTSGSVKANSNEIDVKLNLPTVSITSSSISNIICEDASIQLSTSNNTNYTYQWFKDNTIIPNENNAILEVLASGNYHLEVVAFGCKTTSEEIIIKEFDESVVTIDSPLTVVLNSGETKIINASGADAYEWLDDDGNVLSSVASIEISKSGSYNLLAKVEDCEVLKIVTVSEMGEETVPNALTLNGDGINDTWVLSNQYSFNADVEVAIYDANGRSLLKTTNYQNDWPKNMAILKNQLFFYVIKRKNETIKKGTISVIK